MRTMLMSFAAVAAFAVVGATAAADPTDAREAKQKLAGQRPAAAFLLDAIDEAAEKR